MSSTLAQVIARGLASARPAAGVEGRLYFATDTEVASRDNGTTWDTLQLTGSAAAFLTEAEADLLYIRLDELVAEGDMLYASAAGTPAALTIGDSGMILAVNDSGLPAWVDNYTGEIRTKVKNETGVALTKGQVVYINGAFGSTPTVTLAQADDDATSSKTFGIVHDNTINDGNIGYITNFGLLKGITTTGYTLGAPIWLSASTAGAYTNVKPTQPDHSVLLGFTVTAASNGEMFVMIQNGFELNELHNVLIGGSPADNDLVAYDSASTLWKNQTAAEAGLATASHTHTATVGLDFIIDGGGSAITTGSKGWVEMPVGFTVTAARLLADQSGSIVVDIKKATYSGLPTGTSITASAKPTLSASQKYEDTTLTGWTTSISAGDWLEFVVDSITTVQRVTVSLTLTRTI